MLQTRGVNISVEDYATNALGGTFSDVPRNASQTAGYLSSLYNISASVTSPLGFSAIESNICVNKPVFEGHTFTDGSAHMTLISGTDS